jgi:gliding motility-associated-like protein
MKRRIYTSLILLLCAVGSAFSQSMTISGGNDHGIVICAQGYIYAWGANQSGQQDNLLGLDQTAYGYKYQTYYTTPQRVKTGSLTFSQVTAGSGAFNLGLACNGIVYAWGDNMQQQCGQNVTDNVIKEPMPVLCGEAPGYNLDGTPGGKYLGDVKFIAATTAASFAILNDGRVVGWGGKNSSAWTANGTEPTPVFIKYKDGTDVKNAIHIGCGDDNCLITVDADGDGIGELYSLGPWNGRGATAGSDATCYYAAPVMIGDAKDKSTGVPLTNVKMACASDGAGFAVTDDGNVYSWGNGGWGCQTAYQLMPGSTTYAHKMVSGQYKTVSGEDYLTDIKEIVGGRGYSMAVTKEGYLLFAGNNNGNGGVIGNDYAGDNTCTTGPQFLVYADGSKVTNAVKIARGDNFGFMVNDKDEYYAYGLNDLGQTGLGSDEENINSLTKMTIPCETQDACPEGFMIDTTWKCPGTAVDLYSGFTTPKGKEDSYYFTWKYNGQILNTSTRDSSAADRKADKFNNTEISVTDTGKYEVLIEYIGLKVPCNTCVPIDVSTYLADKSQPIDTLVTVSCVADPLKPSAADQICYKFTSKYTIPSDFKVFAAETGGTALDSVSLTKAKPTGSFCVSGDNVTVHDRSALTQKDTIYSIWIEDATKQRGALIDKATSTTSGYYQSYYMGLTAYDDVLLESCKMYASTYGQPTTLTVTPVVYGMTQTSNGGLAPDLTSVIATGTKQTFNIPAAGGEVTVPINIKLSGKARGLNYFLGFTTSIASGSICLYDYDATSPIVDNITGGVLVSTISTEGTNATTKAGPWGDLVFSKLSSYDCGRMELTSRYYCPPCNQPDGVVAITSSEKATNDTVNLCQGGSTTLSIKDVAKKADPTAQFDILWFETPTMADKDVKQQDLASSTSSYKVAWADIKPGATKTIYLKVRDNAKPDASSCWEMDSIFVKADTIPVVPAVKIDSFCEGSLDATSIAALAAKFDFKGYTAEISKGGTVMTAADLLADFGALKAGVQTYSVVLTDNVTKCVSAAKDISFTVNPLPAAPATSTVSLLKSNASESIEKGATATTGNTLVWYTKKDLSDPSDAAPKQDKSVAGTYYYWVSQKSAQGCESDTARVIVIVNDAPMPTVRDTQLCKDATLDITSQVTKLSNEYQLYWYTDASAAKGTGSKMAPAFSSSTPGKYDYYVSQQNTTTLAESEKDTLTITVYGVDKPVALKAETTYCKGATAASVATMVTASDAPSQYLYADGFAWTTATGSTIAATELVPVTTVTSTTTYNYYVAQTYKIPTSGEVCKGDTIGLSVHVSVVAPPTGDLYANYVKTDAAANGGTFKTVIDQNSTVATPATGCTLKWYESDKKTLCNGTGSAPNPPYDATQTKDMVYTYYVSQEDANGCESDMVEVTVTVSSAPMPTVSPLHFCEGVAYSDPLTATINTTGSTDATSNYELVWYGTDNPNELNTAAEKAALEKASAPVPSTTLAKTTSVEETTTYYVAQRNINTKAVSRAAELKVTVYAYPRLKTQDPDAICEPNSINLRDSSIWLVSSNVDNFVAGFYDAAKVNPLDANFIEHVNVSGTYYVQAYFEVPEPCPTTEKACRGTFEPINVDVHYIRNLTIDGTPTTCPSTPVVLTAKTTGTNMKATASYTWTCADNSDNTTKTKGDSIYTTPDLAGPAGKVYTYNLKVETGACTGQYAANATYKITIGDGPVEGDLSMTEDGNSESTTETVKSTGVKFYSCGNDIKLDAAKIVNTGNDFVWSLNGSKVGEGATYTIKAPAAGTYVYHLAYTNKCATGFDVTVVSVPLSSTVTNTAYDICEGDPFSAQITVSCPESSYKITWMKDGTPVAGQTSTDLKFSPATAADNGVYTYKITNRGCVDTGSVATQHALSVKPYIKFTAQDEYVARRDSQLSIPLAITVPATGDPATIDWSENGVSLGSTNPLSLQVKRDYVLNVKLSDPNYCAAQGTVKVLKDARLQLSVDLDGQMCASDTRDLIIDTIGTGAFVYPDKARLTVVETVAGVDNTISGGWNLGSDGKLHYTVKPASDATYKVSFVYRAGEGVDAQSQLITKTLKVLPPIFIKAPEGLAVCADGATDLTVTLDSVSPAEVQVDWEDDPSISSGLTNTTSIVATPVFDTTLTSTSAYKTYRLSASYSICQKVSSYVNVLLYRPLTGALVAKDIVCEGTSTTIDASSYNAATYSWTSSEDSTVIGKSTSVITVAPVISSAYNVEMSRGECKATDKWTMEVSSNPKIAEIDSIFYNQRDILVNSAYGTAPYTYWLDADKDSATTNSLIKNIKYGKHVAHVVDAAGCSTSTEFVVNAPAFVVPSIITPNGDNTNDVFTNETIKEAFPNATITIYDRWGKQLAKYKGSDEGWDGTYNGKAMPTTDYWYEIEVKEINKTYTGHFTLLRQ